MPSNIRLAGWGVRDFESLFVGIAYGTTTDHKSIVDVAGLFATSHSITVALTHGVFFYVKLNWVSYLIYHTANHVNFHRTRVNGVRS